MVSKEIQQWPEIISAKYREICDRNKSNGADFYFGEHELAQIHLDGSLHISSTKKVYMALKGAGLVQKFPYTVNWI